MVLPQTNYKKTVQTVRIFDGINAEPRIVKYEMYTYGPDDLGIKYYDIVKVISKDEQSVGGVASATVDPQCCGVDADDAYDSDDDDDADAFSAVCAAACEA